jgi:hypothetical protein
MCSLVFGLQGKGRRCYLALPHESEYFAGFSVTLGPAADFNSAPANLLSRIPIARSACHAVVRQHELPRQGRATGPHRVQITQCEALFLASAVRPSARCSGGSLGKSVSQVVDLRVEAPSRRRPAGRFSESLWRSAAHAQQGHVRGRCRPSFGRSLYGVKLGAMPRLAGRRAPFVLGFHRRPCQLHDPLQCLKGGPVHALMVRAGGSGAREVAGWSCRRHGTFKKGMWARSERGHRWPGYIRSSME